MEAHGAALQVALRWTHASSNHCLSWGGRLVFLGLAPLPAGDLRIRGYLGQASPPGVLIQWV